MTGTASALGPDSEPISPRIRRLLEQPPGTCTAARPAFLAEAFFRQGQAAFEREEAARAAALLGHAAEGFAAAGAPCRQADALNELGKTLRFAEQLAEARATYARSLDLAERERYFAGAATALNNLGVLESTAERFRPALEAFAGACALWRRAGDTQELLLARRNLGTTQFLLGRWDIARELLKASARGFESLGRDGRAGLAISLTWLGRVETARGDLEAARPVLERALALHRELGDRRWIAGALDALARCHLEAGRLDDAETAQWQSWQLVFEGKTRNVANAMLNLASVYQRKGQIAYTLWFCRQARALAKTYDLGDPNLVAHALYLEARAEHQAGRAELAAVLMERVMAVLEPLRSEAGSELLAAFFAVRREYFDFQVELLLELGRTAEALEATEQSRARGLLDQLLWRPAEVRAQASADLRERDESVRRRLADTERALAALLDPGNAEREPMEQLAARARQLRFELVRVEAEMRAQHGGGAGAVPLELADMLRLPDDGTVVLVYWLGPERSALWEIARGTLRCHPDLPSRERIERSAQELRRLAQLGPVHRREAERERRALARLLLAPVADRLRDQQLVIVPDGALALVPFAALEIPTGAGSSKWLMEDHEIVLVHSLSTLAAIRARAPERHRRQTLTLSLVYDPVYDRDDPRLAAAASGAGSPGRGSPGRGSPGRGSPGRGSPGRGSSSPWRRLEASAAEGEAIAALVPAPEREVLSGFGANRTGLLTAPLGRARYVHVAAHAEFHPENPELSYLVLSTLNARGEAIEAEVRLDDVARLDLAADLVVLSGCSTAVGPPVRGEGPLAFPRSLLYAGAASVIASLGRVDDRATAALMQALHRGLHVSRLSPAQALRQAQLELAQSERWHDPVFWGSFLLLGDWKT